MTECERIIEQGILPESFFKEEEICDFLVTEKRKKLWAISIDLLLKFDGICRKHRLSYFLAFGSLLGAIRHSGIIPWDDDIDVCMPRKDYEKLLTLTKEFTDPYFLQIPGMDHRYFFSYTKIRNSKTSAVSLPFLYEPFNQGIALDIFPIDNCIPKYADNNWEDIKKLIMTNSANMRRSLPNPTPQDIERMRLYPIEDGMRVLEKINAIATQYNNYETDYGIVSTITAYHAERQIYKWEDVLDTIDYDFYGYKVLIPRNYDSILNITYGNYMLLPPKESRGTWHSTTFIDPDVPYQETLKKLRK